MPLEPPHPRQLHRHALFLDLDGTLADIVSRPSLATIAADTRRTLGLLFAQLGGALAVVSGRELAQIDSLVGRARIAAAGIHGAELRTADGVVTLDDTLAGELIAVESELRTQIRDLDGVTLEIKPISIAIHFRASPQSEARVAALAARIVGARSHLKYLKGNKVAEILPAGIDKGRAIMKLMRTHPFHGRVPIFAGDDVTDEDGFEAVNAMDGISIKIGPGPTLATYGFADAVGFRNWLESLTRDRGATGT